MGLLNELNTINRTLENSQRQLTKSELKEEQRERKKELKNMLQSEFHYFFIKCKTKKDIELLENNLIKNKNQNIDFIENNFNEIHKKKITKNEINFLSEFYYKFMKDIEKEYKPIIIFTENEIKTQTKLEEARQDALKKKEIQQQQAKKELLHKISKVCQITALILIAPFLFVGFFIIGILKNIK